MHDQAEAALSGYRVLDLTCGRGHLCGKILGDLGADVIKIEPPGGDPARRIGPYYHDIPDPEKSLFWFAFNANKRGITLNIESENGRDIFKRLAKDAHFLIESFHPGYLDALGLGYPVLSELNPGIVMTAITPFGQDGPFKARYIYPCKDGQAIFLMVGGHIGAKGQEALETARKVIKRADVVVENFTPRVMKRWGLDYEELRKIKPGIIMVSTTQLGQWGPHAGFRPFRAEKRMKTNWIGWWRHGPWPTAPGR